MKSYIHSASRFDGDNSKFNSGRKFSWFATMVMEHETEKQKDMMRKYYGKYGFQILIATN